MTTDGAVPTLVSSAPGLSGVNGFIVRAFVSNHPSLRRESQQRGFRDFIHLSIMSVLMTRMRRELIDII